MTGFWRQQQKPARMSGLILTPEWHRDSKLRWTESREKKKAKRAAILQSELDGGDVSMGDGEEEGHCFDKSKKWKTQKSTCVSFGVE